MYSKLKSLIRVILAGLLYYSGLLAVYSFIKRAVYPNTNVVILSYHRIADDKDQMIALTQPGMYVTKGNFELQMKFMAENYNIMTLKELAEVITRDHIIPQKSVIVTFDDGWSDNYDHAFPILQKYKVPAIIFLATDLIETNKIPEFIELCLLIGEGGIWPNKAISISAEYIKECGIDQSSENLKNIDFDKCKDDAGGFMRIILSLGDAHIKAITDVMKIKSGLDIEKWENTKWMLSWEEIEEMIKGGIDFGSHGKTHRILTHLTAEEIKLELTESKRIIEEKTGKSVLFFAYPNSNCNPDIIKLVQESNYIGAVAGRHAKKDDKYLDPFAMRRINMNEGAVVGCRGKFSKAIFACRLSGLFKQ